MSGRGVAYFKKVNFLGRILEQKLVFTSNQNFAFGLLILDLPYFIIEYFDVRRIYLQFAPLQVNFRQLGVDSGPAGIDFDLPGYVFSKLLAPVLVLWDTILRL